MKDIRHAFGRHADQHDPIRDVPCVHTTSKEISQGKRFERSRGTAEVEQNLVTTRIRINITAIGRTEGFECRRSQTEQVGVGWIWLRGNPFRRQIEERQPERKGIRDLFAIVLKQQRPPNEPIRIDHDIVESDLLASLQHQRWRNTIDRPSS